MKFILTDEESTDTFLRLAAQPSIVAADLGTRVREGLVVERTLFEVLDELCYVLFRFEFFWAQLVHELDKCCMVG